jgi:hypothetical protein
VSVWREFWLRFLSPQTARFILALLAIGMAQYAMMKLMGQEIRASNRDALMLALGIVLGLSKDAFGYYFGSTARSDERPVETKVVNDKKDPVPTEQAEAPAPKPDGPEGGA